MKKAKDTPLSGDQIAKMMDDLHERANIMVDSDIKASDSIEDVFKGRGHVILFHPWKGQEVGHWVCMVRNPKQCYYFDSFGKPPYNKNIAKVVLKKYPELLVNNISFQPTSSNACGRYALLVCSLNKMGLVPKQIEKFLKSFDVDKFVINTVR